MSMVQCQSDPVMRHNGQHRVTQPLLQICTTYIFVPCLLTFNNCDAAAPVHAVFKFAALVIMLSAVLMSMSSEH